MAGKSLTLATVLAVFISPALVILNCLHGSVGVEAGQAATDDAASLRTGSDSNVENTPDPEATSSQQTDIQKKLDELTELRVEKMPLTAVIDAFEKLSDVTVTVELTEMALRGVDPQTSMTFDEKDVSLRSLIDLITQRANLTFEVQSGGIRIPATTSPLEFRKVPGRPDSDAGTRVPENWQKLDYRDGTVHEADPANEKGFAWFPIRSQESKGVELPVTRGSRKFRTGLLSDSKHDIMTADGSWHVVAVNSQDDGTGTDGLRVKLDQAGDLLMRQLSKNCLDQKLAIVVNGVIITAATVRSEIGGDFIITGQFSNDELTRIADGVRRAMVPPRKGKQ